MYDELVKRLRNRRICIQQLGTLNDYPLLGEAADAIEELQKRVPKAPHGRLIDADALAEHKFVCIPHVSIDGEEVGRAYRLGWNTAIEAIIENAETIIGEE